MKDDFDIDKMLKNAKTFLNRPEMKNISSFEVEVMAVAKGYAMVRRKGCLPFVVREKDLIEKDKS